MSGLRVASFFPFRRLKVFYEDVKAGISKAHLLIESENAIWGVTFFCLRG